MGKISGVVGFGLGYWTGMKVGDRPIRSVQRTAEQARTRVESLSGTARRMRSSIGGVGGRTTDVREVGEVMTTVPETIASSASLRDAAQAMLRANVGDVLVTDGDQLRGILTDRDITIRAVAEGRDVTTTMVSDVLTPSVVSVTPTAPVQEAVELMRQHDVRRLPVVRAGRPVGIVSIGDLAVSREPASLLADITVSPPNT